MFSSESNFLKALRRDSVFFFRPTERLDFMVVERLTVRGSETGSFSSERTEEATESIISSDSTEYNPSEWALLSSIGCSSDVPDT